MNEQELDLRGAYLANRNAAKNDLRISRRDAALRAKNQRIIKVAKGIGLTAAITLLTALMIYGAKKGREFLDREGLIYDNNWNLRYEETGKYYEKDPFENFFSRGGNWWNIIKEMLLSTKTVLKD